MCARRCARAQTQHIFILMGQYDVQQFATAGQCKKRKTKGKAEGLIEKRIQTMKFLCQQLCVSLLITHPQGTWVTFQLAQRGTWHLASQGQQWDVMEYD